MTDDSYLRERVRDVIEAGKLPNRQPDHIWGGPGSGAKCVICDAALERNGVELEIQFLPDDGSAGSSRVHVSCFSIFELERVKLRTDGHGRQALGMNGVERLRTGSGNRQNPGRGSGAAY